MWSFSHVSLPSVVVIHIHVLATSLNYLDHVHPPPRPYMSTCYNTHEA